MMTLLEFACEKLLGPPNACRGDGQSEWACPHCGGEKFHTYPHKDSFKDRFRCWSCLFRGDIFDLLKEFFPSENYGDQLARVADWEVEFAAEAKANPTRVKPPAFSSGETGIHGADEWQSLQDAYENLTQEEREGAVKALAAASREKVSLQALALLCDHKLWIEQIKAEHFKECTDAECDAIVCRAARGLPPLTQEEIKAGRPARLWETRKPQASRNGRRMHR